MTASSTIRISKEPQMTKVESTSPKLKGLLSIVEQIKNNENSTARKVGEVVTLIFYCLSGLVVIEALTCLAQWTWQEVKLGLEITNGETNSKAGLIADVTAKAKVALTPIVSNIITLLMDQPEIKRIITGLVDLAKTAGMATVKQVVEGKTFKDATSRAISPLKETQEEIVSHAYQVLGVKKGAPSAKTDMPSATSPALSLLKDTILKEFKTTVLNQVASDSAPSKKMQSTPLSATAALEASEKGDLERRKAIFTMFKNALQEAPGEDKSKEDASPLTSGVVPEVSAMFSKYKNNLTSKVTKELTTKLLDKFGLGQEKLPEEALSAEGAITSFKNTLTSNKAALTLSAVGAASKYTKAMALKALKSF